LYLNKQNISKTNPAPQNSGVFAFVTAKNIISTATQKRKGKMAGHFVESDLGFDPQTLGSVPKEKPADEPSGFSQTVEKLMAETGVSKAEARALVEQVFKQLA